MKSVSKIRALAFDFFIFFNVIRMFQGCLQSMSEKEVEAYVMIILPARTAINKKGDRKHIPLSKNAKDAVLKKK